MKLELNHDLLHKVDYSAAFRTSLLQLTVYRILGLLTCLVVLGAVWYAWWPHAYKPLHYLTIWCNLMLGVYFFVALICSKVSVPLLERANHLLYQATAPTLVLICIFFWTALLPLFFLLLKQNPDTFWFHLILNIGLHLVTPAFGALEIYYNQICIMFKDTVAVCGPLSLLYMAINYYVTITEGVPVYPPIDWETYRTPAFIAFALLLELMGYYAVRRIWVHKVIVQMTAESKKE